MTLATFSTSIEAQQAAVLLEGYRFEVGNHDARQWVSLWLEFYRPVWIRDAVVEALYQGRYKSRSVKQILELWERRGQPVRHATHEFEAAICREFGEVKLVTTLPQSTIESIQTNQEAPLKERASRRIHQSLSAMAFHPGIPDLAKEITPAKATTANESTGLPTSNRQSTSGPTETVDLLRSHQQHSIPFSSARAIQPFKPALPFSAQTLRLAKKKAFATT
ncbi:hypothetical protein S7335_3411 [Synechococcus sp. PCC 7335]|uniref:hypothetical protein n=1 Tax=Synechococcus sp. (strain ATCC 29403 / PCC 7335) TaxID=91464 RepID=UPI00017ED95B|nr:hypothetical protein [Synechococcus sp. PCC 7335]EDX85708.1 hypothetical protein S7335_3411 [Synechococcus sp. PCC 7335]